MSIPGRSHLCWTPESLVGRLACVARQVSPGRVCHLTISSLTHSLPAFLDLGSVSPGHLADCGWTAMSLFDMSLVFGSFLSCQDKFAPDFW